MRLFDVASGEELRAFPTKAQSGPSIAIASDGQRFAVMDNDGTVRLWEVASGKEQFAIDKHKVSPPVKRGSGPRYFGPFAYVRMVFAPDGKVLATGNDKGVIFLWDAATGKLRLTMEAQDANSLGAVASLSFSPDGKSLVASHRKTMVIWDPSSSKDVRRLDYPENVVNVSTRATESPTASYLADGKTLFVRGDVHQSNLGSTRNNLGFSFVDVESGKPCRVFDGPVSGIMDIVYARDGLHVAGTEEGKVHKLRVWEARTGRLVFQASEAHRGTLDALAFTPQGSLVAAYSNEIVFWDVKTRNVTRTFAAHHPIGLAIAADGTKLATCENDRTIRLRDLVSGKELLSIQADIPKSPVFLSRRNVAFSADLRLAATADPPSPETDQGTIQIWDLSTGKEAKRLARGGRGDIQLAFSPDGRTLLETTGNKMMYLWEVASGELRQALRQERFAYSAAYSPDGRHIAFGEVDQRALLGPRVAGFDIPIHVYDVAANRFVSTFHGHEGTITSLSFSADGRFLASGSTDMTGLLWNMAAIWGSSAPIQLTAKERATCWADLAGAAKEAFPSMWMLVADKEAVSFLRENLAPAKAPASQREIQKLVADLGSDQVPVRTQAAKELTNMGPCAEEGLRQSLVPGLALETHRRVEEILRAITRQQLRLVRAIEVLETIHTPAARRLLEALAEGDKGAWQTREAKASLERLTNRAQ